MRTSTNPPTAVTAARYTRTPYCPSNFSAEIEAAVDCATAACTAPEDLVAVDCADAISTALEDLVAGAQLASANTSRAIVRTLEGLAECLTSRFPD